MTDLLTEFVPIYAFAALFAWWCWRVSHNQSEEDRQW